MMTFAVGIMCGEGVVLAADTMIELLRNDQASAGGEGDFLPGTSKIRETTTGFLTGCGIGQLLDAVDDLLPTLPLVEPHVIHHAIHEFKDKYRAPRHIVDATSWLYSYEGEYVCNPGLGEIVKNLGVRVALFHDGGSSSLEPTPAYSSWPRGIPDALCKDARDFLGQFGCHDASVNRIREAVIEVFGALQIPGVKVSNDLHLATHLPGQKRNVERIVIGESTG